MASALRAPVTVLDFVEVAPQAEGLSQFQPQTRVSVQRNHALAKRMDSSRINVDQGPDSVRFGCAKKV